VPLGLASIPDGPLLSVIGDYDGFRHSDIDAYAPIHSPRMGTTTDLAVAPANTSQIVRAGKAKAYRSADTGSSWSEVATMLPADSSNTTNSKLALSANGGVMLHAITIRSGETATTTTYRSANFSAANPTWTAVTGLGTGDVRPVADPVNANKFYVYDAGDGGVKVSTNGGASFTTVSTLATGGAPVIRTAPGREGEVWVALNGGGLMRSTNSGSNFTKLANVTSCSAVGFGKTMTGASDSTVFIWGAVSGNSTRGLYRSTDAGATWVRINDDAHQYGGPGNGQLVVGDMNAEGMVYMSPRSRALRAH
jgi:photosystem II stability/assembly factor-like uncharacterized protein